MPKTTPELNYSDIFRAAEERYPQVQNLVVGLHEQFEPARPHRAWRLWVGAPVKKEFTAPDLPSLLEKVKDA